MRHAATLFASCGELSNSHASTRESNVQEKADRITFHTVFQLARKLTDEEYWVMRLFSKENQVGGLNSDSKWEGGGGGAENTFFPITL